MSQLLIKELCILRAWIFADYRSDYGAGSWSWLRIRIKIQALDPDKSQGFVECALIVNNSTDIFVYVCTFFEKTCTLRTLLLILIEHSKENDEIQGDHLYMAVCFWYLIKSDLSSEQ